MGKVPLSKFHHELCDFVDNQNKGKKLLLLPRGHLKSTIVTCGYSLKRIAENPQVRILIANATYEMACSFLSQIRQHLVSNTTFRDLYGDLAKDARKWSENMITVASSTGYEAKEATVTAYGVGGNLVSQHYDVIIMDDVVNRDFVNTKEQIQKTIDFYRDALDLLEPNGTLIILGTRWHDSDLYGWILDETSPDRIYDGFDVMVKQAYTGDLQTGENLEILYPEKFTREHLVELLKDKGPVDFSAQYMNDPIPAGEAKFKPEWIQVAESDELKLRNLNYFMCIDPAIANESYSDYTAFVVVGVDEFNNWWIRDIVRARLRPDEIVNKVFDLAQVYNFRKIGIEFHSFQRTLQYALNDEMRKRGIYLPLVELKLRGGTSGSGSGFKEQRIESLIPRYASGSVYHLRSCPNLDILKDELMRFPVGKHDDVIDALAYINQIAFPARANQISERGEKRKKRYLY